MPVHTFIFSETEEIKIVGLTPEREYVYRVASINDAGIGEFSENKTVRTEITVSIVQHLNLFQAMPKVKQPIVLKFVSFKLYLLKGWGWLPPLYHFFQAC